MAIKLKRYKVKMNSLENARELLQEAYDETCRNLQDIQNQINQLKNSTDLTNAELLLDSKAKYAKAMNDFILSRTKAIAQKVDIAKLLTDVVKDCNAARNASSEESMENMMNWDALKEDMGTSTVDTSTEQPEEEVIGYQLGPTPRKKS